MFHFQARPWFVSDTTKEDIDWVLDNMAEDGCKKLRKVFALIYISQKKTILKCLNKTPIQFHHISFTFKSDDSLPMILTVETQSV